MFPGWINCLPFPFLCVKPCRTVPPEWARPDSQHFLRTASRWLLDELIVQSGIQGGVLPLELGNAEVSFGSASYLQNYVQHISKLDPHEIDRSADWLWGPKLEGIFPALWDPVINVFTRDTLKSKASKILQRKKNSKGFKRKGYMKSHCFC